MDFYEKFGIEKDKAVFLFIDMVLVILGFFASLFIFAFVIIHKYTAWTIATNAALVICYTAVVFYASGGYKHEGNKYFMGAIGAFSFYSLINLTMRFRTAWDLMILAVVFGLSLVFMFVLDKPKTARIVSFVLLGASFGLSIYGTITAITNDLGTAFEDSVFAAITLFYSIWAPVIVSSLLVICYDIKISKAKREKQITE